MSPVLKAGPVSRARYEALRILVRVEQDRAFADIALEHALEEPKLDPREEHFRIPSHRAGLSLFLSCVTCYAPPSTASFAPGDR